MIIRALSPLHPLLGASLPPYIKRLKKLPAPSTFAKFWGDHQQGKDKDAVFNCMRPMTAVVRGRMGCWNLHD